MRTSERTNLHLVRRPPAWWCCRRTGGGSVDTEASSKKGSCGLRATQAVLCVVCGRSVAGDGETAERRRAMVAIPLWRCAEAEGGESRPRHEHRSWLTTKRPVLRQMPRGGAVSPGAGLSQGGGSIDLPSPVVGRGLDSSSGIWARCQRRCPSTVSSRAGGSRALAPMCSPLPGSNSGVI